MRRRAVGGNGGQHGGSSSSASMRREGTATWCVGLWHANRLDPENFPGKEPAPV